MQVTDEVHQAGKELLVFLLVGYIALFIIYLITINVDGEMDSSFGDVQVIDGDVPPCSSVAN